MQYLNTLLVALMAFAAGTSALAIPVELTTRVDDDCIQDAATQLKNDQSTLFGWQLAGAAVNDDAVNSICNDLNGVGSDSGSNYGTWGDEGLVLNNIKYVLCRPTKPNTTTALPMIRNITTSIYTTLVNGSFDISDSTVSSYLCNNLDHSLIASFNISDNYLIDSICSSASSAPLPAPIAGTSPNETATAEFVTAASKLYAIQYASAAGSDSTLNQWCARLPDAISNIDGLDLSGQAVHNTVCGLEKPPCYVEGQEAITEWNSKLFAIFIQNGSNMEGYREWLCGNLKVEAMDGLGLNGTLVRKTVCGNAGL